MINITIQFLCINHFYKRNSNGYMIISVKVTKSKEDAVKHTHFPPIKLYKV